MFESRWNHLVWPYVTYGRSLNQLNEMNVTRRAANRIQAGRSLRRGLCVCSPRQARTYQASEVPRVGPTSGLKDRAS